MSSMDTQEEIVKEFGLEKLPKDDQEAMLTGIGDAIQKRFFIDVYEKVGKHSFEAILASLKMGKQFYVTTLKHVLPNYEDVFAEARRKVKENFTQEIKK